MNNNRLLLPLVVSLGAISLVLLAILVFKGVGRPQNVVPSKAAGTTTDDPVVCQGNPHPDPKCFKCETGSNKNNPIGILDFSCFAKYYGQKVGSVSGGAK